MGRRASHRADLRIGVGGGLRRGRPRPRDDLRLTNARTLFELGSHAHALRALWSLARRQKPLPPLRTLRDTDELETSVIREFGLGVVALHSSKHRAEATKEISRVPPDLPRMRVRSSATFTSSRTSQGGLAMA